MKKPSQLRLPVNWRPWAVSILFYIALAALFVLPVIQRDLTEKQVSAQLAQYKQTLAQHPTPFVPVSGTPISISIPRLGIKLPIVDGYYNPSSHKWTLDMVHAFINANTVKNPQISNEPGSFAFIYAHDFMPLFEKTAQLVPGDLMDLTTTSGATFTYVYQGGEIVEPTNLSILQSVNDKDQVTLMTCSGAFYQVRHAMFFNLIHVSQGTSS